jgi:hypothetical protein
MAFWPLAQGCNLGLTIRLDKRNPHRSSNSLKGNKMAFSSIASWRLLVGPQL